jgi:riboflavin biosynthesis pyrimidine reductase
MHALPLTGPDIDGDALFELYTSHNPSWVRMNFVSTIDGAVEVDGRSAGLGGEADKTVFGVLRTLSDGILVGAGTLRDEHYRAVRPTAERRAWREAAGMAAYPRLVVVSGALDLEPTNPALAEAPVRPVIITHGASDDERRDALSAVADVRVHGVDRVDLVSAVAELRARYGLAKILCEGGPHLFGALYAANLVDEVCLTLSPLLAGPGSGRIIAGAAADAVTRMHLVHALESDGTLLLRYARS